MSESKYYDIQTVTPWRLANTDEISFIRHIWENCIRNTLDNTEGRLYFHIYLNDRLSDLLTDSEGEKLKILATDILSEITSKWSVKSAGFLINKPNCPHQSFHVDYAGQFGSIFLNLTPETEKCATQFIEGDCRTIDDTFSIIHKAVQYISPSPVWLVVPHATVHRGIENREMFDRVIFWILYRKEGQKEEDTLKHESLYESVKKNIVAPYTKNEYQKL